MYTLTGTNTYLIGSGKKRILIDAGDGKSDYIDLLNKVFKDNNIDGIDKIIVTHWHHDHLGGVPSILEAFGSEPMVILSDAKNENKSLIPVLKYIPDQLEPVFSGEGALSPYDILPKERFTPMKDGDIIKTEGATLRVLFTPGHANDHCCLYLEEEKSLFTGDNILGIGTGVFKDLTAYIQSLQRLKDECSDMQSLFPAHGPELHGNDKCLELVSDYISHRMERVRQVRSLLNSTEGKTVEALTRAIYTHVPDSLFLPAMNNTQMVLQYLEHEKIVKKMFPKEISLKDVDENKSVFENPKLATKILWFLEDKSKSLM